METIKYSVDGGVAVITLSHPPTNAYDLDRLKALDARIVDARFDPKVHVILVTGDGDRFFCGGADIAMLTQADTDFRYNFCLYTHEVLHRLEHAPKLTVCAMNGHAIGGGLEIALACDLRVVKSGKVNMGFPEVNVGVLPGSGGTQRLPRLVGKGKALEMLLDGTFVGPEEAAKIGLVNRVWEEESHEAFQKKAFEFARGYAAPAKAPLAVGRIKRAVQSGLETSLEEGLALERELIGRLFDTDDAKEGFAAFGGKRKPSFQGK